jgi:hypothetical protein
VDALTRLPAASAATVYWAGDAARRPGVTEPGEPREQFVVDKDGERVAVILPIADYERLIEELEQVVDLRAVAEADAEPGDDVDADTFFDALYRERSWRTAS